MKKYIIPNTEAMEVVQCFTICDPSAGKGSTNSPGSPDPAQGGPGGVRRRVF